MKLFECVRTRKLAAYGARATLPSHTWERAVHFEEWRPFVILLPWACTPEEQDLVKSHGDVGA